MKNGIPNIQEVARIFQNFAEHECKNVSPLYYQLSLAIAEDYQLLQIAAKRRERQPIPNLFLAAVHYLLLKHKEEELGLYYPSISKSSKSEIPFDLFKTFCLRKEEEIISIIQERIVQTNAVNRTAYLMPIISSSFQHGQALNIIDIGTSSGLALNYDLYEYHYSTDERFGESPAKIKTSILAGSLPMFDKIIHPTRKIGIDQNPLDIKSADNATWLKALIWPDHLARFERIESAITLAAESTINLFKRSKVADFKEIIEQIPQEEQLFIYHTHVLYQFNVEERKDFRLMLDEIGKKRDFQYLAVEGSRVFDQADYELATVLMVLTTYQDGHKSIHQLGSTNGHANWIKWNN